MMECERMPYSMTMSRHVIPSSSKIFAILLLWGTILGVNTLQNTSTEALQSTVSKNSTARPPTVSCDYYGSSCENCSHNKHCAWCFSEKSCKPVKLRERRKTCKDDDWYYGDCDKPIKEEILIYVLLCSAVFLLLVVILLVMYIFLCKVKRNNDYEPVNTDEKKKKRKRTPLMSKKIKPSGSRTEELKKKYQLDR
ncbi:pituitary tumor-transforming gene 1 protein-interacting protein-like [Xenia sp. Carnegie-2017]|uniref:pituitary tumor-transforming gene 1 protein-interacting protein-like n=1 Tax=Xenia sp. Carnegie-2017 TaxID=2897299 RepID=UPI001F039151|nr:pituitary tumor-transforming gene 1 protein-interacting protein-like [Xenia sp. Carnegie-2017]